jgi:hypothetical protein
MRIARGSTMATRSEAFHANQQRHPSKQAKKRLADHMAKKDRIKRKLHAHENVHAGKKATVALELPPKSGKRPSRKSTRSSANRSKFDSATEHRGGMAHASPEGRFRNGK